ncbi:MAG: helix-turn-helix domain-containing protein [Patescibacteria group bacterium]|nr:helix-turn-helix domain-containing protein [Patescibacteria group bacterium]
MADSEDITEEIRRLMKAKGIGPARLANLTDIPSRFVDAILEGDFDNLPARPYIRGYLFKISNVLGAESDHLWQMYRSSSETHSSGEKDKLPFNRFALKRMNRSVVIGLVASVALLVLLALNFNRIVGRPTIEVSLPDTTEESVITVSGLINPEDRLTLNEEIIYTDDVGHFEKQVQLEPGLNTLVFKVNRYLGRETILREQVFYQLPPEEAIQPTDDSQEENQ